MKSVAKPAESGKWERVRRLRYGALIKLYRHRWGPTLPDDSSGRDDLFELVCVVSVALSATDERIMNTIETNAPWMTPEEAQMLVEHVQSLTIYERMPNNRVLGERMNLTNAERERLHLWAIKPTDMTDEQLAEQRKVKSRERRATRRRQSGVRTRAEYLAELASKPKPWEAEGISQRQWQRRCRGVCPNMSRGSDATNSSKGRTHLATSERGVSQRRGLQRSGEVKMLREATEAREVESQKLGSSPALRPHPATPEMDERLMALNNWGKNAEEKIRPFRQNRKSLGRCLAKSCVTSRSFRWRQTNSPSRRQHEQRDYISRRSS
jgi:hypothetical protein